MVGIFFESTASMMHVRLEYVDTCTSPYHILKDFDLDVQVHMDRLGWGMAWLF